MLARLFSLLTMTLDKLTSAVYNDIQSGLAGFNANPSMSLEQLADECLEVRDAVVREWWLKGLLRRHELSRAINCVSVDCADQNKCTCVGLPAKNARHFEIPQLLESIGDDALEFVGTTDRSLSYDVYFTKEAAQMHKHKRRNANKPYVYIERALNSNGMYDCWLYNAPFVTNLAVIGIFKDPRQLAEFNCCGNPEEYEDFGSVSNEVKDRLIKKKIQYYRQFYPQPQQTNLIPR